MLTLQRKSLLLKRKTRQNTEQTVIAWDWGGAGRVGDGDIYLDCDGSFMGVHMCQT